MNTKLSQLHLPFYLGWKNKFFKYMDNLSRETNLGCPMKYFLY